MENGGPYRSGSKPEQIVEFFDIMSYGEEAAVDKPDKAESDAVKKPLTWWQSLNQKFDEDTDEETAKTADWGVLDKDTAVAQANKWLVQNAGRVDILARFVFPYAEFKFENGYKIPLINIVIWYREL